GGGFRIRREGRRKLRQWRLRWQGDLYVMPSRLWSLRFEWEQQREQLELDHRRDDEQLELDHRRDDERILGFGRRRIRQLELERIRRLGRRRIRQLELERIRRLGRRC